MPSCSWPGPAASGASAAGPRSGDSWLKPDVTAPGVSITLTGSGTGNGAAIESGTSMATPFVAGVAALVRQAHPQWKDPGLWRDAIVNTANPALVAGYSPSLAGAGLVQVAAATRTGVMAEGPGGAPAVNFGFAELSRDYVRSLNITVRNVSSTSVTFKVSKAESAGSPHSVSLQDRRFDKGSKDQERSDLDRRGQRMQEGLIQAARSYAYERGAEGADFRQFDWVRNLVAELEERSLREEQIILLSVIEGFRSFHQFLPVFLHLALHVAAAPVPALAQTWVATAQD